MIMNRLQSGNSKGIGLNLDKGINRTYNSIRREDFPGGST